MVLFGAVVSMSMKKLTQMDELLLCLLRRAVVLVVLAVPMEDFDCDCDGDDDCRRCLCR